MAKIQRTCTIPGCGRKHRCGGFCAVHYEEFLRTDPSRPRCSVDGCDSAARRAGLCGKHYQRLTKWDDPTVTTVIRNDDNARWDSYIKILPNGCHEWTGYVWKSSGYGRTSKGRDSKRAHIVIWERDNGPVPPGMTLDHLCHNEAAAKGECLGGPTCPHRRCVNPAHLSPKPIGENQRSSANTNSGRTDCKRGHEFTPENTHWYQKPDGTWTRVCRACAREKMERRRDRLNPNRKRRKSP